MRLYLLFTILLLSTWMTPLIAQNASIQGTVMDRESERPVVAAMVALEGTNLQAKTAADGSFLLTNIPAGAYTVLVSIDGATLEQRSVNLKPGEVLISSFSTKNVQIVAENANNFTVISFEQAEDDANDGGEISGILRAGRDVFQNATSFNLFAFRFNDRGYGTERTTTYLNGVRLNDPEVGWVSFSDIGGLNDVLRNRTSSVGLDPVDYSFGDVGGASNVDTRASTQRKQFRASYAISNRSYRHRLMATYNTGMTKKGWAFSFSGSRRWAEEGYIPGTFYDAYSYFAAVDKKINDEHNLSFTVLAAPTKRGRGGDAFQEQYDLAGTNFYNPRWGYWNDKKRNASVFTNNAPLSMFRYDWKPSRNASFTTTVFHQQGTQGSTRLDWFNASNPNPDYNRNLPSAQPTPEAETEWADYLKADESNRQIDWAKMYAANQSSAFTTINNAEGIVGNQVSGFWSQYILEDQRQDNRESGANMFFNYTLNHRWSLQGGGEMSVYNSRNYKVVDDLLGGDFYMDYDKFGAFDPARPVDPTNLYFSNNLDMPDNVLYEGDEFGYNFDENVRRFSAWSQLQYIGRRIDFHVSGQLQQTGLWREGNSTHYNYPTQSKGKSEILNFISPSIKGGLVYKFNNRYYAYVNGELGERPPLWQDAFLSPRVLNRPVQNVTDSKFQSLEGGIQIRTPKLKGRLTGYVTEFQDETDVQIYFSPTNNTFGNLAITGIDRRHAGIEAALEYILNPSITLVGATSLGQYLFTSRPNLYFIQDNSTLPIVDGSLAYQDGYFVPRSPQTAAVFTVKYSAKRHWFANLSVNYADNLWYEFDRLRRTASFVETIEKDSPLWNKVLDQQKAPAAYTLDFFGGKSWKLKGYHFLYLNVGVNNLLDNKEIITWGRDTYISAFRESNDARRYSNELSYSIGRNYFISLTFRY